MMLIFNVTLIALLLVLSAFFSGSETGVYRISRVRLRIGLEQGKRTYKLLFSLLKDGQGLILTLLLGNNLVNYFLTGSVTFIILTQVENVHLAEVYSTAILTPVLFIFAELIPKNLMYYRADKLLPNFAWLIWSIDKIFTFSGAKAILKKITNLISFCFNLQVDSAKAIDVSHRHQVHQIIHETQEEGLLSQSQREMMTRLVDFPSVPISSVMIPLHNVHKIPASMAFEDFIAHLPKSHFTRQLVYGDRPTEILGYVTVYDVLAGGPGKGIREHVEPILSLDKKTSVIKAINLMRNQRKKIALVTEPSKKGMRPVGMITIVDLIEEITGEMNI